MRTIQNINSNDMYNNSTKCSQQATFLPIRRQEFYKYINCEYNIISM